MLVKAGAGIIPGWARLQNPPVSVRAESGHVKLGHSTHENTREPDLGADSFFFFKQYIMLLLILPYTACNIFVNNTTL